MASLRVFLQLLVLTIPALAGAQMSLRDLGAYDVVVVGSEPEAISAAVAAAEEGATTLLLSEENRLGGLFVLGGLNVLDLRSGSSPYQQGLFLRWWRMVGHGPAFSVDRAEAAFAALLEQAGVEVRLGLADIQPHWGPMGMLLGVEADGVVYLAHQVIDGTGDMDFAAEAGADFSVGFRALGVDVRMADTLVFRVQNVNWHELERAAATRGPGYAIVRNGVAWGHFGGYPAAYQPDQPGLRLRGLNLGRQDDGSVLVNALLIHGIDPFDPASLKEGYARAEREASRVVTYLAKGIPGFADARLGGVAEKLYLRETRHLDALCTLTVDDLLDNRVTSQAVAAGGYPLDVQALTPNDTGFVFGTPTIYGVPLCVTVPTVLDSTWVVGKAAGYDPLAASSARVVPLGMALAEAVGVAASLAARLGLQPGGLVGDPGLVGAVQRTLIRRGAFLPEPSNHPPVGPVEHPHYPAYRLLLSRGLAVGGYDNQPDLQAPMSGIGYVYLLGNVGERFHGISGLSSSLVVRFGTELPELTPDLALAITAAVACLIDRCPPEESWEGLRVAGIAPEAFGPETTLTRGQAYALAAGLAEPSLTEGRLP